MKLQASNQFDAVKIEISHGLFYLELGIYKGGCVLGVWTSWKHRVQIGGALLPFYFRFEYQSWRRKHEAN